VVWRDRSQRAVQRRRQQVVAGLAHDVMSAVLSRRELGQVLMTMGAAAVLPTTLVAPPAAADSLVRDAPSRFPQFPLGASGRHQELTRL
jgi:hypothetical protein